MNHQNSPANAIVSRISQDEHTIIEWNFTEQKPQLHSVACPIENAVSYPVAREVEYAINYPVVDESNMHLFIQLLKSRICS